MIATVIIAVLALAALVYVLGPLLRAPRRETRDESSLRAEAQARKDAALTAILDVELEQEVGKLSPVDAATLRAQYEAEALAALKELDALHEDTRGSEHLEDEIATVRERLRCPSCGAPRMPGDRCPRCGEQL